MTSATSVEKVAHVEAENLKGIAIQFDTIFGAAVGFEYVPRDVFEYHDNPAQWAFMIELFFFRILFTKY
jgi:hypothetical protein